MSEQHGKQALMDHYRELVNRRSAGHKPTTEQDYDALDQLMTDVGEILDDMPALIYRLQRRTEHLSAGASRKLEILP